MYQTTLFAEPGYLGGQAPSHTVLSPFLVDSGGDSRSAAFLIATLMWHMCTLSVNASLVGGREHSFTDDTSLFPVLSATFDPAFRSCMTLLPCQLSGRQHI